MVTVSLTFYLCRFDVQTVEYCTVELIKGGVRNFTTYLEFVSSFALRLAFSRLQLGLVPTDKIALKQKALGGSPEQTRTAARPGKVQKTK